MHLMSRSRACTISTSASFGLVGTASFENGRPLISPVISCIASWRIGCRRITWVTWTASVGGCSIARDLPR